MKTTTTVNTIILLAMTATVIHLVFTSVLAAIMVVVLMGFVMFERPSKVE